MRLSRIHLETTLALGNILELPSDLSHYLSKVLRLKPGNSVTVFNAAAGEFLAEITDLAKHSVSIKLLEQIAEPSTVELQITIGLGLSRGERMDFAIQKSTELGVARIVPLITLHGEVKLKQDRVDNKLRHWRKIATNASEQSGRLSVPEIEPPRLLRDWDNTAAELNILLDPRGAKGFSPSDGNVSAINLLIGPEGGFAEEELAWGRENGYSIVSLGQRILRTETAPVAALAILQNRYGDM